ncbi:uncharacterized protein [Epargyreus clarus]|uniref:uncharacterized protein isoform X3 n=1 Tax=Epargyreus clarus TaxID=520877 RepID=UPI003C2E9AC7
MYLFWILTGIFAVSTVHGSVQDKDMWYKEFRDADTEEMQDYGDYEIHMSNEDIKADSSLADEKKVEEEIEKFRKENGSIDDEYNEEMENIDDYQIEDNRSEVKDDYADAMEVESAEGNDEDDIGNMRLEEIDANKKENTTQPAEEASTEVENVKKEIEDNLAVKNDKQYKIDNDTSVIEDGDIDYEDEFGVLMHKIEESNFDQVAEETKRLLAEEPDNDFALDKSANPDETKEVDEDKKSIEEIYDEEVNFPESPEETDLDDVDKDIDASLRSAKMLESENDEQVEGEMDDEEDTVYKAYGDLVDDLNKLTETLNKLKDKADEDVAELEKDYEEIDDKNLSKLFEEVPEKSNEDIEDNEDLEGEELDADDEVVKEKPDIKSTEAAPAKVTDSSTLIPYVDDALVANDIEKSANDKTTETTHVKIHDVEPLVFDDDEVETTTRKFNGILKPGERNTSFNVFKNSLIIDEKNRDEPVRITLSMDKPVVLTSPDYPSPYPTNAVFDWILEGEGAGIEFNVTDLALNGNNGDFVVVKPGREDPSGADGVVFSFGLDSERHFRFLNVNKVFVRFRTMPGMRWRRGFSFNFKLMGPVPPEVVPEEPTPDLSTIPDYRLEVNLGLSLMNFSRVEEQFRLVIADMATMYINEHNIEPGLNSTRDVTVIRSTGLCFLNWPHSDDCAIVAFGVPLRYRISDELDGRLNEEDLKDMWDTYSKIDPFETRLTQLGIWEFQVPDDSNVLMVWLVIAAGVVISMAMLAFALWRFSCFEEYTKMPAFSDTESVNEKKTLDLYPTPHQTLPPLYAEAEYKWGDAKYDEATRVDMGGFTNRSYARTEDYDFESDEEVGVPARDRLIYIY